MIAAGPPLWHPGIANFALRPPNRCSSITLSTNQQSWCHSTLFNGVMSSKYALFLVKHGSDLVDLRRGKCRFLYLCDFWRNILRIVESHAPFVCSNKKQKKRKLIKKGPEDTLLIQLLLNRPFGHGAGKYLNCWAVDIGNLFQLNYSAHPTLIPVWHRLPQSPQLIPIYLLTRTRISHWVRGGGGIINSSLTILLVESSLLTVRRKMSHMY